MSVLLETSLGDIIIDLLVQDCPKTCENFLKLCKIKYYDHCIFHNIQRDYIIQTGDPSGTGNGGSSIYGILQGEKYKYFEDEIQPHLKHSFKGIVGMANPVKGMNGSQFYITTADAISSLDGKHTIFGFVTEGLDTVMKINNALVDPGTFRPLQLLRIQHTSILDDPFDDPIELPIPSRSPSPPACWVDDLLDEDLSFPVDQADEVIKERLAEQDARAKAEILTLIGDLPDMDVSPPENVLFVCKLNPLTTAASLEILFSRFGILKSADIVKDRKGNSLCYGFVEFEEKDACEEAYLKTKNILFDERHIHVDFSQSVSRVDWRRAGGWRKFFEGRAKSYNRSEEGEDAIMLKRQYHNRDHQIGGGSKIYGFVSDVEPKKMNQNHSKRDRHQSQGDGYQPLSSSLRFEKRKIYIHSQDNPNTCHDRRKGYQESNQYHRESRDYNISSQRMNYEKRWKAEGSDHHHRLWNDEKKRYEYGNRHHDENKRSSSQSKYANPPHDLIDNQKK